MCNVGLAALAAEGESAKCTVEQTAASEVTVTVNSDESTFSVAVYPKGKSFLDLPAAGEATADSIVYVKEFKNTGKTTFNMDLSNTRSGDYTLYLSENGEMSMYDFKFLRKDMKGIVYKKINASTSAGEIKDIIEDAYSDLNISDGEWNGCDKDAVADKLFEIKQQGFVFDDADGGKSDKAFYAPLVINLLNRQELENIYKFIDELDVKNTDLKNHCDKTAVAQNIQLSVTAALSSKSIVDYDELMSKMKDALILSTVHLADNYTPAKQIICEFAAYIGVDTGRISDSVYADILGTDFATVAALAEQLKAKYGSGSGSGGTGSSGGSRGGSGGGYINPDNITAVTQPDKMPQDIFEDLSGAEWAKEAIISLAEKQYICGKAENLFCPNDNITRYEFTKIIANAFLTDEPGAEIPFGDVSADSWAYEYVKKAFAANIINGKDGNVFDGDAVITREEMAVILHRAALKKNIILSDYEDARDFTFRDDGQIDEYAKQAVYVLRNDGVINGVGDDMFAPKQTATRAEAAQMIYLLINL